MKSLEMLVKHIFFQIDGCWSGRRSGIWLRDFGLLPRSLEQIMSKSN